MKYILLLLFLTSCSFEKQPPCKSDLNNCVMISTEWQLQALNADCEKLSKCMKMDWEILHFTFQPHNPYACHLQKTENGYTRSHYFYPKGEISFGEVSYDRLSHAISTCEMMTGTGEKSKQRYDEINALFKKMDEDRAKTNKPKPTPAVKVREVR